MSLKNSSATRWPALVCLQTIGLIFGAFGAQAVQALSVDLQANPVNVAAGGSSTLSWKSSGAKSCWGSGYLGGNRPLNGTFDSGRIWQDRWYNITCTDGSSQVTDGVMLRVEGSKGLSVDLAADPPSVSTGGSSTVRWKSTGAKWCWGGGKLSGTRPLSGTVDTGPVSQNLWYEITCSDGTNRVSDNVNVTVGTGLRVDLQANPVNVAAGGSSTLSWKSSGAKSCWGSGYLGGNRPLNGTFDSGRIWQDRWYNITCTDGSTQVTDGVMLRVEGSKGLSVDLAADPPSVSTGGSSTVRWKSTGAKWCWGGGKLSGTRPLNGTVDTGPVSQNLWYEITCSDGTNRVSDNARVTVDGSSGTEVSVRLDADPSQIGSGASSMLRWSSQGATSCTAGGGWSGSRALSGSYSTGALSKSTSYSLTCQNGSRTAWSAVTVQVDSVPVVRWQAPTQNVDGSPLMDLAGYRFYWGKSSRSYTGNARINDPALTQYQPSQLASGEYYVTVTAIDTEGNESDYSNEVKIAVP